jgi:small subunit ribosomal protein S17
VRNSRKTRIGIVVSNKMQKTIAVEMERTMKHPIYQRVIKRKSKLYAHDEKNECCIGDKVLVMETRPLSKLMRWRLIKVIEKAV